MNETNKAVKIDWENEKAAGWAGRDIMGCHTMDPSAVVTEKELREACEDELYRKQVFALATGRGINALTQSVKKG